MTGRSFTVSLPSAPCAGGLRAWRLALAALCLAWAPAALAEGQPSAAGEAILTATGDIKSPGANIDFDLDALKALPVTSFATTTPWTKGVVTFTGVALKDFVAAVGPRGRTLHCVALNDYAVDIPVADAVKDGPIIAYLSDGKPMSVRQKGPLWIVYPYDRAPEYRTETAYARSIWQLRRVDIVE
jgi:hypothetical protein